MKNHDIREKAARYFLLTEWKRMREDDLARNGVCKLPVECPAIGFIHECLSLLDQYHDSSVRELAPAIRRLITERTFIDENGDCCVLESHPEIVRRELEMIIQALEQFRESGIGHSRWSDMPSTPIMFG